MSREYPDSPRVGVGVIVWRGGRMLLVRRARPPSEGEWSLPGGAQELGETLFQAAAREVAEETGMAVEPVAVLTAVDGIDRDAGGRVRFHYTLIDVVAEWRSGEPVPADDVAAVRWAAPGEAERLVTWSETRRVIRMAADQRTPPSPPAPAAGPRIRRSETPGRLMRTPLGRLIARPWLDTVTLRLLADWLFPMSRAWAAAALAGGDLGRFCAEVPIPPPRVRPTAWLRSALIQTDAARTRLAEADAAWQAALFGDGDDDPGAEALVAAEEARLDAAHAFSLNRLRFAAFARAHRVAPCRWSVPAPEEVEARHGARLADPGTAYAPPDPAPPVAESRRLPSDLGREYFLRLDPPWPGTGGPCWARVFEPAGVKDPPTVIHMHGICVEMDQLRVPWREVEALWRRGVRVVAPEAPWHGRRRAPGRYGGEPFVATAPLGALEHFAAHVRELAVLTRWARRTGRGPVGWSGTSLGAFTAQLAAAHSAGWPPEMRADAVLLMTTAGDIEAVSQTGGFARAFGVDRALAAAGWTPELLRRWAPLLDPLAPPAMGADHVFMVLGAVDDVAPFACGLDLARRWQVPEANLSIRPQGHFSIPTGLLADEGPIAAFCAHLAGSGV